MLHLVAKYPNPPLVSDLPSPALEMQQELLMFKEVEVMMQPSLRETKNAEGQTPQELFTIGHAELLESGEKWMKNTTTSCLVVATLIATVVFTVAITVPSDNNDKTGIPICLMETTYIPCVCYNRCNRIVLLFNLHSNVFVCLTSGYTKMDFQRSLPLKLMVS
ncbi:hypothetical protein Q3G72_028839 [Acer saccharum]|nr:hypothetical protein Q3G72_028839 [Acer saccharum]